MKDEFLYESYETKPATPNATFYLVEPKALFLHIPRTGGNTIKTYMSELTKTLGWKDVGGIGIRQHVPLMYYKIEYLKRIEFIFSFVRHPADWYESIWRFFTRQLIRQRREVKHFTRSHYLKRPWTPVCEVQMLYRPDFYEWIELVLDKQPCFVTRMYELFLGPERREICHFIGRTETLAGDWRRLAEMLGFVLKRDVTRWHRTTPENSVPRIEWPDELRQRVEHNERLAIERFYGTETIDRREYRKMK
jgi:hypothetical protein